MLPPELALFVTAEICTAPTEMLVTLLVALLDGVEAFRRIGVPRAVTIAPAATKAAVSRMMVASAVAPVPDTAPRPTMVDSEVAVLVSVASTSSWFAEMLMSPPT